MDQQFDTSAFKSNYTAKDTSGIFPEFKSKLNQTPWHTQRATNYYGRKTIRVPQDEGVFYRPMMQSQQLPEELIMKTTPVMPQFH